MRFDRKLQVPEGYELAFKQANAIFHHARVYDGRARKLSFLKPLPERLMNEFNGDLDFLGPDLPPSRALAIAEGRLDPISMCAFNELKHAAPSTTQPVTTSKEPEFFCGSSHGGWKLHKKCSDVVVQEDVWLGTDEKLFEMFAAADSAPLCSPSSINTALSPRKVQIDNGFVAHLASISSSRIIDDPSAGEQGPTASNNVFLSLSSGKTSGKRVLPLPPNNNPFKRGRISEGLSRVSDMAASPLNSEVDEQLFSKKHTSLVKSSFREHNCENLCELGQSGHVRHESHISVVTGDSVLNESVGSEILGDHGISSQAVPVSLHAQDSRSGGNYDDGKARDAQALLGLERVADTKISWQLEVNRASSEQEKIGIRACMVKSGYKDCGLESQESNGAARLQEPITANSVEKPESQDLVQNASHRNFASQPSCDIIPLDAWPRCDASVSFDAIPRLVPEPTQSNNAGSYNLRTPIIPTLQQKESKTKKAIRSSRQSSKVVASPSSSTLGLLKFFQRTPTL